MLAALLAGERDPKVLAELARGRLRAKRSVLEEAFTGHFTDHHGFLLARMLARWMRWMLTSPSWTTSSRS
jgi:transposase